MDIEKQFEDKGNRKFRLRASNIGRATCQLWFMKNKPEKAVARGTNFLLRMLIGDITEAVFKGVLTEAGVNYGESLGLHGLASVIDKCLSNFKLQNKQMNQSSANKVHGKDVSKSKTIVFGFFGVNSANL